MAYIKKSTVICVIFLALYNMCLTVEAFNRCYGQYYCTSSFFKYCCKRKSSSGNICRSDCVGQPCDSDSDCAREECCDSDKDECKPKGECDATPGWLIAVIVISVCTGLIITVVVVVCRCCCAASRRRPAHAGVIMTQPATTGSTVLANQQENHVQEAQVMHFHNPVPPYPNQHPAY